MGKSRISLLLALTALCSAPRAAAEPIVAGGYLSPDSYPDMTLLWRDEFSGPRLDVSSWTHETGNGVDGWGNGELQYHQSGNAEVRNGYLVITARREQHADYQYTSSRLTSRDGRSLTAGRVDVRVSLPSGQGIWPALRLRTDGRGDESRTGIDIVEMIGGEGREDTVHGMLHWRENGSTRYEGGSVTLPDDTFTGQFHVFSVVWDESQLRWLADDREYFRRDIPTTGPDSLGTPLHFIISLAVGGNWPGAPDETTDFPQRLVVDYVRMFQKKPASSP